MRTRFVAFSSDRDCILCAYYLKIKNHKINRIQTLSEDITARVLGVLRENSVSKVG